MKNVIGTYFYGNDNIVFDIVFLFQKICSNNISHYGDTLLIIILIAIFLFKIIRYHNYNYFLSQKTNTIFLFIFFFYQVV
jgi:hypothetical protein